MYVRPGGGSERGARARRLPAAAAAHLAGGVAPARGPRERRRRSARGAHAPTWAVPPGPGGTWRDRRDLDFWRDQKFKDAFLGGGGTTKVGFEQSESERRDAMAIRALAGGGARPQAVHVGAGIARRDDYNEQRAAHREALDRGTVAPVRPALPVVAVPASSIVVAEGGSNYRPVHKSEGKQFLWFVLLLALALA